MWFSKKIIIFILYATNHEGQTAKGNVGTVNRRDPLEGCKYIGEYYMCARHYFLYQCDSHCWCGIIFLIDLGDNRLENQGFLSENVEQSLLLVWDHYWVIEAMNENEKQDRRIRMQEQIVQQI